MGRSFRALANANYRLYFYGQLVSMTGSFMQGMVQGWLVYRLSGSALWLGIISFCTQFSAFIVSPIAGDAADQKDRRKLLIWIEAWAMVQAFALAALFFTGALRIWQIAALGAVLGVCNAYEIITRHSFAVDIVGKEDLASAISLNSMTINASRVVGPALAGIFVGIIGEGWCFFLNGVSFLAVIYGLWVMKTHRFHPRHRLSDHPHQGFAERFADGARYVRAHPRVRNLLLASTFISLFGFPCGMLLPVFAKEVLSGGAGMLAWLTGAVGAGAVLGAIGIGMRAGDDKLRPRLAMCFLMMGVGFAALGLSHTAWLSVGASFWVGFFMMGAMPMINNAIQQVVDDSIRGRVMSLYTMTFLGATPIGSLAQGWIADRVGAGRVALGVGAITAAFGLLVAGRGFRPPGRSGRPRRVPLAPPLEQRAPAG